MIDATAVAKKYMDLLIGYNTEVFKITETTGMDMNDVVASLALAYMEVQVVSARVEALVALAMGSEDTAMMLLQAARESARNEVLRELSTGLAQGTITSENTPVN